MQTSPCYCDIIFPTDTKVHQKSYSRLIDSLTRFLTYRCPSIIDSRKIHLLLCLPGIFYSNLSLVSPYEVFQQIVLAAWIWHLFTSRKYEIQYANGSHMDVYRNYDLIVVHVV